MMEFVVQWEDGTIQQMSGLSVPQLKDLLAENNFSCASMSNDETDIARRYAAILLKEREQ